MKKGNLLLILLLFIFIVPKVSAHPHMLLLSQLTFEFEGEECLGVRVDWGFDSMFSQSIIDSYDWDWNGEFDTDETTAVYNYAFINLENYGYFLSVRTGTTRFVPKEVEEFSVWLIEGRLYYNFFVSFDEWELGPDFSMSVFDPTYFCAVQYQTPSIIIDQRDGRYPFFELEENKDFPVYYNPLGSVDDATVYEKWEPGLETAYPEEAHVYFP